MHTHIFPTVSRMFFTIIAAQLNQDTHTKNILFAHFVRAREKQYIRDHHRSAILNACGQKYET